MNEDEISKILTREPNFDTPKYPQSIKNAEEFYQTLSNIRTNGVCVTCEDYYPRPMVFTIAAPIFNSRGFTLPIYLRGGNVYGNRSILYRSLQ
jgi:DNA-binding IclR family transcriptional regulator